MADRNMPFSQNQGFGMMQGLPQYVQPGAGIMHPQTMMMGQTPMMGPRPANIVPQGQMVGGQGMYPVSMMPPGGVRMMRPSAPPSYDQARMDSFHKRSQNSQPPHNNRQMGKTEEQLQKERFFQQQQAKLKQFGKSGSSNLDPNKLIDSMFGGLEAPKPRSNKKQQAQLPENNDDDGFGDFLSGPHMAGNQSITQNTLGPEIQGTSPQMKQAVPTTVSVSVSKVVPTKPAAEKKDLTKMMFESCDLKAPQKAKLFQKPSLKDITVPYHETHLVTANVSMNARKWEHTEELSDLFIQEAEKDVKSMPPKVPQTKKVTSPTSKHPPKPPPWLTDESVLPPLYGQVLEASLVDGKIATDRVYPILLLSGLPKEKLGFIWGLCNQQTPGQLIVKELVQILAIIALTQNNFQVDSTDILFRCPHPPVPFLGQPASPQSPVGDLQQNRPVAPPHVQMGNPPAPISQSHSSQSIVSQIGQPIVSNAPAGNQEFASPATFGTSVIPGTQHLAPNISFGGSSSVMSSPATLPVTQLPPAVLPQGMMGNVVNSGAGEDDFADFQAAEPAPVQAPKSGSFKALMADVKGSKRPPVKDQSDYLSSVPIPDDKAIAESMSPEDFKSSTVSNFFASDDSSEATSPDDDYFDGYKSAESKPSDSTSQFSTDQSENEDFKNFESYLDEFQKKKEMRDKESPLHRPVPKGTSVPKPQSSVKTKLPMGETKKAKLPVIDIVKTDATVKNSSDEFSDFADFQSAPVTVTLETPSNPFKTAGSASDLIGEEDKYAALRSLDLSELSAETEPNLLGDVKVEVNPVKEIDDDNWADFETVVITDPVAEVSSQADGTFSNSGNKDKHSILKFFSEKKNDESEWGNFNQSLSLSADGVTSDWSAFSEDTTTTNIETQFLEQSTSGLQTGKSELLDDDWADFQSTNNEDNFDSFQSAIPDTNKDLVTVKNDKLRSDEILSLFKVRETPIQTIKSMDDDVFSNTQSSVSISQTMNRLHGISPSHEVQNMEMNSKSSDKKKHLSEEDDDFMKPPPLNSVNDDDFEIVDEFGTYAGGYDLGDMMEPKPLEKKNMYGVYGLNQNFIVTGHKKDSKQTGLSDIDENVLKNVTIEVTKESDMDDSDSMSSKDDTFRGKFGLGKDLGEDSQSVSSLDFIVNKHINNVKDGDNQSMNSNDFGNFDNSAGISGSSIAVESKSVDSLELRQEEDQTGNTSSSQDNSDKDSKEQSPERDLSDNKMENRIFDSVPTTQGLPIVGDRYSFILSDVPGSDKHAYEWQRLLDNACRMIQDANNIFNSISSSSVCNEVIRSTQGSQYVQGVVEIYRVVCKIFTSMKETGIHSDKLSKLAKDIDLAWNNLTAFLVGGSVMPDSKSFDYSHGILHPEDATAEYRSCGICLLNVEMKQKGLNSDVNANLTYGGKQYHASCANFWINCVDSTLPALKLTELL